ncbi:uncharacterized protein PAC_01417 [Phialocephala subalpina]|uniref:Uncharacterized protein n=1 Tax=Phialocephala subalpina TaxID=576137 RepID=A0A1L7WFJ6_9HELO|nr:uncharacterized protein PAC_01417 [Phialocephala subalpina]
MQSSVQAEPPRLGDIPRTFSNDSSVLISKEVSITSSRAPTPIQRASYSSMPPTHIRPQTTSVSSIPYGTLAAQVSRWNSLSKNSEKSSVFQFQMRPSTARRPSSADPDLLESNRESMKALSDFLMTREPPPNNFMSIQSSDDDKSLSSFKKSAYKLLGKSKKKKSKTPRLMRLPDSAVAAKTRQGARHIAISIPIEHDHMEPIPRPLTPATRQQVRSGERERTDRTAVHVLKPVTELRESASSYLSSPTSPPGSRNGPVVVEPVLEAPINPLGFHPLGDIGRPQSPTLGQNAGAYLNYKPEPRIEPRNAPKYDPKKPHKSYVAVSPIAMQREDNNRSDPWHSGGTMYNNISIAATPQAGHSRQVSSVSTAPSATATGATVMTGLKIDLPPRNSSISKVPTSIQAELANSSRLTNEKASLEPLNSPAKQRSTDSYSPSPPLVIIETAQPARKYSGLGVDGIQLVRSTTPRSQISPPPNKSLPDIPSGGRVMSRPSTAPPVQSEMRITAVSQIKESTARRTASTKDRDFGKVDPAFEKRQSRQERVKERKQRDIEALRSSTGSKAGTRSPLSESNNNRETASSSTGVGTGAIRSSRITTPPRNPKRNGPSSAEKRRLANSVTPIMLVANLPPYTGHVSLEDLRSSSLNRYKNTDSQSTTRALRNSTRERTPPHSPTALGSFPRVPESGSSQNRYTFPLTGRHSRSPSQSSSHSTGSSTPRRSIRGRTQSLRSSVLETRRQERRAKRNLSLREQDLDDRMRKIERDNAVLLHTLGGIARSFGQLHHATSRRNRSRRGVVGFDGEGREIRRGRGEDEMVGREERGGSGADVKGVEGVRRGELRSMEPVMRELQGFAPRVSEEVGRVSTESRGVDGFEE